MVEVVDVIRLCFNCTEYEAKALLALYVHRDIDSRVKLAEVADIPSGKIYGIVDSLVEKELVYANDEIYLFEESFETILRDQLLEIRDMIDNLNNLRVRHIDSEIGKLQEEIERLEKLKEEEG